MKRTLVILFAFASVTCLAQTGEKDMLVELQTLQIQNMLLRKQVDSLERVLKYRKLTGSIEVTSLDDDTVVNTWDLLVGGDGLVDDIVSKLKGKDGSGGIYEQRLSSLDRKLMVRYDEILGQYIESYTVTRRKSMAAIMQRYGNYSEYFRKVFRDNGIPEDITLLCVVESAVNPQAVSHMGAAGMWQIMPDTAVEYGLSVSQRVDERYDVTKSTETAVKILLSNYRFFADWPLAICAYNCGSGNVQNAIRKAGGKRDFWSIYEYLPKETRAYLPSFIAAIYYYNFE